MRPRADLRDVRSKVPIFFKSRVSRGECHCRHRNQVCPTRKVEQSQSERLTDDRGALKPTLAGPRRSA